MHSSRRPDRIRPVCFKTRKLAKKFPLPGADEPSKSRQIERTIVYDKCQLRLPKFAKTVFCGVSLPPRRRNRFIRPKPAAAMILRQSKSTHTLWMWVVAMLWMPTAVAQTDAEAARDRSSQYGPGGDTSMNFDGEMETDAAMYGMEATAGRGGPPMGRPGMGGPGMGGPGMRGSAATQNTALAALGIDPQTLISSIPLEALAAELSPEDLQAGPVLAGDAVAAFQHGDYPLALETYYAAAACGEDPDGLSRKLGYLPSLKRPVWAIRFGLAMAVRGDESAPPMPLEQMEGRQNGPAGMAMNMGRGDMSGMEDMQDQMQMEMMMEQEQMAMEMGMGMPNMSGDPRMMGGPNGFGTGNSSMAAPAPTLDRPMLSEDTIERIDDVLGLVATHFGDAFEKRVRSGQFGMAMNDVRPPTPKTKRPTMSMRTAQAEPEEAEVKEQKPSAELVEMALALPEPPPMYRPALPFLGEKGSDEALVDARRMGLDFLIQFDVNLKERGVAQGRAMTENISRIRMYHVPTGKSFVSSKPMNALEAQRLLARGQLDDTSAYVDEQTAIFWANVDKQLAVKPLPTLSADAAKNRIGQLFGSTSLSPLRKLSEVRAFESLGYLTEDEAAAAFDMIAGSSAMQLIYGSPRVQRENARELIGSTIRMARQSSN